MRIAPVSWDKLDDESRRLIEEGMANGMYPETSVMQVVAHNSAALASMHEATKALYGGGSLGHRLQELLRIRSAQINGCDLCAAARKDDTMSDDDLACDINGSDGPLSDRERLALRFLLLMATDHHAIDDTVMRDLGREFTAEQIVELGWYSGMAIGGHRFLHALDMVGDGAPFIGVSEPETEAA